MKRYLDLIPISAKVHKKQSRMVRLCIILAVFLVTVIFGMADMEIRSQRLQALQSDGGWHAGFKQVNDEQAAMIAARPETKAASRYGVLNYGLDAHYKLDGAEAAVCGFDKSLVKMFPAAKAAEGEFPADANGAMVTKSAKQRMELKIGDRIRLDTPRGIPHEYTVTGFTGDTSLLTEHDAMGVFLNTEAFRQLTQAGQSDYYDSMFYVQFSAFCDIQKVISDIQNQLGLSDQQITQNIKMLGLIGQSDDPYMLMMYGSAAVLAALVIIAGILMIASSMNSNISQRTEFFGMMRCLGASRKQVIRFVRLEALHWCKTAVPIGLLAGVVVVWALCAMLKFLSPTYFGDMPVFRISWIAVALGIIVGLLTVLLAAQAPAKRASKVSPLTAVSGNADTAQMVRKAANTGLFKVDTALGIHHAKTSKKNLMLMVGSFAFSIILFLAFSAAVDFMHHALTPLKPYTPDLSIVSPKNTCSVPKGLSKELAGDKAVKRVYGRMFAYDVPIKKDGKADVISYEKHQFDWAEELLVEGSLDEVENGRQVLTVFHEDNPLKIGSAVTLDGKNGPQTVTVAGVLSSSPFKREKGSEQIICSEETFKGLTGETDYTILDLQLKRGAGDEDAARIRQMAGPGIKFSDQRMKNSETMGAYYSMALFIYGFLAVIALISIFNIINSISMSVAARLPQYGAMRAIGMDGRQLVKMVAAEALTYAGGGVVLGCAVGLPINKFLFENLVTSRWGESWAVPLIAVAVIILIVAASTLIAVRGPSKRIRSISVVDTISAL